MSFILAPFPFINLRASPLEFTNFNILSASINLISKLLIIALGNALSVIMLLNVFAAAFEIRSASSSLLHNLVTSLAKIILASFISAPFNFSSLLISVKDSSVNNFKNFITSGSSVFLQYCQKSQFDNSFSLSQTAPLALFPIFEPLLVVNKGEVKPKACLDVFFLISSKPVTILPH